MELAKKLNPFEASWICKIPIKNLKRWVNNGYYWKKGGRKTQDPLMETKLVNWIDEYVKLNHKLPEQKVIKNMALEYSNYSQSFKASKGWYEKFMHWYRKIRNLSPKK